MQGSLLRVSVALQAGRKSQHWQGELVPPSIVSSRDVPVIVPCSLCTLSPSTRTVTPLPWSRSMSFSSFCSVKRSSVPAQAIDCPGIETDAISLTQSAKSVPFRCAFRSSCDAAW